MTEQDWNKQGSDILLQLWRDREYVGYSFASYKAVIEQWIKEKPSDALDLE